jgi:hypothetical protein
VWADIELYGEMGSSAAAWSHRQVGAGDGDIESRVCLSRAISSSSLSPDTNVSEPRPRGGWAAVVDTRGTIFYLTVRHTPPDQTKRSRCVASH